MDRVYTYYSAIDNFSNAQADCVALKPHASVTWAGALWSVNTYDEQRVRRRVLAGAERIAE
jgi:hypothetical protein